MIIRTVDLNGWFEMTVSHGQWRHDKSSIEFELNNLSEDTPERFKVPNETGFVMSIEDAWELHAWLGSVLVKPQL